MTRSSTYRAFALRRRAVLLSHSCRWFTSPDDHEAVRISDNKMVFDVANVMILNEFLCFMKINKI